jgi:hypothetical protein
MIQKKAIIFMGFTSILLKRYGNTIIILLLICFAVWLRIYRLEERIWWSGDQGRDLIVASHIVKYHEYPEFGHSAAYLTNPFFYPQYYYYLLACLSFISNDPIIITYLLIPIHLLGIVSMYLIGKRLYSSTSGLLAAFWYTVSNKMIEVGNIIWPAFIAIPISLFGYALVLNRKWRIQIIGFVFIVLATTIHMSSFLVLFLAWYISMVTKQTIVRRVITTLLVITFEIIAFIPVMKLFGIATFINRFSPLNNLGKPNELLQNTARVISDYTKDLFGNTDVYIFVALVSVAIAICYVCWKRLSFTSYYLFLFVILSLLIAGIKGGQQGTHYVFILTPFIFLGLSQVVNGIHFIPKRNTLISIICIIILFGITYGLMANFKNTIKDFGNYTQYKNVSDFIFQYNKGIYGTPQKNYRLSAGSEGTNFNWESYALWYFLEKKYGKITELSPTDGNISELQKDSNVYYQICFFYSSERIERDCLAEFESINPSFKKVKQIQYIDNKVSIFEYIRS